MVGQTLFIDYVTVHILPIYYQTFSFKLTVFLFYSTFSSSYVTGSNMTTAALPFSVKTYGLLISCRYIAYCYMAGFFLLIIGHMKATEAGVNSGS